MTRSAKPRFLPWDVVLVPFPFTESNYNKVRPSLIVSTEPLSTKTGKYFLSMITSALHARSYGDVLISDLKLAGLPGESIIRPGKIATFEETSLGRRIGTYRPKTGRKCPLNCANFCVLKRKDDAFRISP